MKMPHLNASNRELSQGTSPHIPPPPADAINVQNIFTFGLPGLDVVKKKGSL